MPSCKIPWQVHLDHLPRLSIISSGLDVATSENRRELRDMLFVRTVINVVIDCADIVESFKINVSVGAAPLNFLRSTAQHRVCLPRLHKSHGH